MIGIGFARINELKKIMNVYQIADYKGSKDYAKLAELAKTQSVICVVDYQGCRDVAQTVYSEAGGLESWQVSARGIAYISAFDRAKLLAQCESVNLEFIEPPPPITLPVEGGYSSSES